MFDAALIHSTPLKDFVYFCFVAWGVFLLGGFGLWRYYGRLEMLKDTPRSLIRSAAQGYVELQGTAKLMPGDPIVAPLSGKRCVWWSYRIESRSRRGGNWRALDGSSHDTSTDIFMIDDGTGQCVVDPDKSEVTAITRYAWSGDSPDAEGGPGTGGLFGRYRYIEYRIEQGAPLCALGYFHTQDPVSGAMIDEEVRQQLAAWKHDQAWVLQHFDKNHDGQVDFQEWDVARQEARRLVLEKERENLKRPPVNVLSHPRDGRQFIISAMPREKLMLRLRLLTLVSLLAFFAGGAYGTWLADARLAAPPSVNSGRRDNLCDPNRCTPMSNPLLDWDTLPPFAHIKPEHVEPALDTVLKENRAALEKLATQPAPDWQHFVEPLESLGDRLHRAWAPVGHLNAAMSTPELRAAYNACLPKLSEYSTEISQDERLQKTFLALKQGTTWAGYSPAQKKLIDDALLDFRLAGVDLSADKKVRYKAVSQELSKLDAKFEENVLDATQGWFNHVKDEARLAGIPENALQQARADAEERKQDAWVFTLDYPSYSAVVTHADDRALRRELYEAFSTRASDQGPTAGRWDNTEVMQGILKLRQEEAHLTGFPDFTAYSLADKMAPSPAHVLRFLEDLVLRVKPLAQHELLELAEFALERDGVAKLEPWDMAYYGEKLKEARYHVSDEMLRPYFPAPKVTAGLFQTMQKLYGLAFSEVVGAEGWHPDVKLFALHDEAGTLRGHLYTDLYTRSGKRGGAWMDETLGRRRLASKLQTPVAFLNCNFPPPVKSRASLLTHDDVVTLFHELGHCLHHLLTQVDYPSVGGINGVAWDAVELPSQFHENFAWTRVGLDLVSGHFETGAKLPEELYQKMQGARHFHSALFLLRQLEFALFDFRLHMGASVPDAGFVQRTLEQVREQVAVVRPPAWNRFAHGFTHIFSGGYAAGYYSYLWAEVLAADAYGAFEEAGVFDKATGRRFMHSILEQGGSRKAMELFVEFRGREPTLDAFLRLNGLAA